MIRLDSVEMDHEGTMTDKASEYRCVKRRQENFERVYESSRRPSWSRKGQEIDSD